jgi:hypothetical protein
MILQGKIEFDSFMFDLKPKSNLKENLELLLNHLIKKKTFMVDFREGTIIKYDRVEIDIVGDNCYFKMFVSNPEEILKDKIVLKLINKEVDMLQMFRVQTPGFDGDSLDARELGFCNFNLTTII